MQDATKTISLTDLLNEVDLDLDELRKKHASDYGVKNITTRPLLSMSDGAPKAVVSSA